MASSSIASQISIRLLFAASLVFVFSGCSVLNFGGPGSRAGTPEVPLPFDARIAIDRGARDFTVSVAPEGAELETYRESVRYQATRVCLVRFGSSDVEWSTDPSNGEWSATRTDGGRIIYSGRCKGR